MGAEMSVATGSIGALNLAEFDLPGDPAAIRASAASYEQAATVSAQVKSGIAAATAPGWVGAEGEAFRARVAEFPPVLDTAQEATSTVARELQRFAADLAAAQAEMAAARAEASELHARATAAAAGVSDAVSGSPWPDPSAVIPALAVAPARQRAAAIRARVDAAARACGAAIQTVAAAPRVPPPVGNPGGLVARSALVPATLPPALADGTDPAEVASAWAALPPEQRQALLENDPARWGNQAGVPVLDRDAANRLALERDLADGAKLFTDAGLSVPRSLSDLDGLTSEDKRRIGLERTSWASPSGLGIQTDPQVAASLQRFRNGFATEAVLRRPHDAAGGPPAYLHTFDPGAFDGEGRAAIAYGDPDRAANVAVTVPGLNSRVDNIATVAGDARALERASRAADPGHATAVLAWQGYNAPEFRNVAFQGHAREGGQRLADDVAALRATSEERQRITVAAHSYGSTTTGLALQNSGLADHVDQVALLGSPGVGGDARNVGDLHLRPEQLFVGSASRDAVTTTWGQLGADPAAQDFGGTRFKAEHVDRASSATPWQFKDHSRYYDAATNSESLFSLSRVVTGRGGELGGAGMVADGRTVDWAGHGNNLYPVEVDPEAARQPTSGHVP